MRGACGADHIPSLTVRAPALVSEMQGREVLCRWQLSGHRFPETLTPLPKPARERKARKTGGNE
jgi:hypothetical protein